MKTLKATSLSLVLLTLMMATNVFAQSASSPSALFAQRSALKKEVDDLNKQIPTMPQGFDRDRAVIQQLRAQLDLIDNARAIEALPTDQASTPNTIRLSSGAAVPARVDSAVKAETNAAGDASGG